MKDTFVLKTTIKEFSTMKEQLIKLFCMKFHIKRQRNYMWYLQRVEREVKLQM